MEKYDRYSCVNCKFLKKDEEYPNEEHYKCVKCVCYVAKYKDDYTLRYFGYGEVKIRPACSLAGTYAYVSHNPARLCRWYKEK